MLKLGIILTAATVTILVVEFFRARRRPLPAHGWLGLIALVCAEYLMFHGIEPAATYFSPLAWTAYILIADAAIFAISGHSRLRDEPRGLLKMAALSDSLVADFEAYNLRLANWMYVGLPQGRVERWFGYAWSFATITPAIFMTAALIESFGWFEGDSRPLRLGRAAETVLIVLGATLLIVPLLVPRQTGVLFVRPGLARLLCFCSSRSTTASTCPRSKAISRGVSRAAVFVSRRGMGVRLAVGVLELLGSGRMDLHFSNRPAMEDLPDARAGLSGFPGVCARMFRDVRNRRVALQPQICCREEISGIIRCAIQTKLCSKQLSRSFPE